MLTLTKGKNSRIIAVPYKNKRARKAVLLPDGAIMDRPTAEQRSHFPRAVRAYYPIDADGRPTNKDEAVTFLGFNGFFVTPTGEALAIYGAHDDDPFS